MYIYIVIFTFRVYQDKLAVIKKQLQQLYDGTHVEYLKHLNVLEIQQKNE